MSLQCWKCGASLAGMLLPLSRRETCPSCRADLHVCKLCRHYDAHRAGQCRELAAERVADKGGGAAMAQASRSALDALFAGQAAGQSGGGGESTEPARPASLDDLFKK
jgi:hypothetical protein